MRRAIFPGTFDPFTIGHASVVRRALTFIDEIVIGIGINENKNTHFPIEKREKMIRDYYRDEPRIKVQSYDCLTIDFAKEVDASLIIRGIRTVKDFEYEETIADINRKLTGIETILLFTEPELTCVSSTTVRELLQFGKDISMFLPAMAESLTAMMRSPARMPTFSEGPLLTGCTTSSVSSIIWNCTPIPSKLPCRGSFIFLTSSALL